MSSDVRVFLTGSPIKGGAQKVASVGLMETTVRMYDKPVEGVRLFVKGKLGRNAHFGKAS